MRIDRRHRPWLWGTCVVSAVATGLYVAASRADKSSPGHTVPGLILGAASALLIGGAVFLGIRRRFVRLPLGAVAGWLRAHLWIGLLSLLLALYHGGFRLGSPLTTGLMIVLCGAVASGIFGAFLQHVLPALLSARSSNESVGDSERTIALLRCQAYQVVWAACGQEPDSKQESAAIEVLLDEPPNPPPRSALREAGTLRGQKELAKFYRTVVLPFFTATESRRSALATAADAVLTFDALAAGVADALMPTLTELGLLCERVRQARRQIQMQHWIHGWLLAHIPLSMALLVLLAIHVIAALRY